MDNTKIKDLAPATTMVDTDYLYANIGGSSSKISLENLKKAFNENEDSYLQTHAFYIEPNVASTKGSTYCNVGGNSDALQYWKNLWQPILMDASGNYTHLSKLDTRYTENGVATVDMSTNEVLSAFAKCDFMVLLPDTWLYIQDVAVGSTTKQRAWFSPTYIPGSTLLPKIPVGMFKASIVSGSVRSLPNKDVRGGSTIEQYFSYCQARSKNHGLSGGYFRTLLITYMMSVYGQRDVQNAVLADGTKIWGPGLDGTENTTASTLGGWDRQQAIVSGATLSLGSADGKVAVTDAAGGTCHKVRLGWFEDPYADKWEFDGHRAHVGSTMYEWDSNVLPKSTNSVLSASSFANLEHRELTMASSVTNRFYISDTAGSHYFSPIYVGASLSGVAYNDNLLYDGSDGVNVLLWGGPSYYGSSCGLAYASADSAWSSADASFSARLDFHGDVRRVTTQKLLELAA